MPKLKSNQLEKVSSPASRAGHVIERVRKMREAGVSPATIASQMTKNSKNGQIYTVQDVDAFEK